MLLDGPRARGAFLLRCLLSAPWSIRLEDRVPLSLTAVVRGGAWAVPDDAEPVALRPGDVVVAVGPRPWTLAHAADAAVTVVIGPGQECVAPDGRRLTEEYDLGVRTWGNSSDGDPSSDSVTTKIGGSARSRRPLTSPSTR